MDEFRVALLELFPDVDRVAININVYCDPIRPPEICEDQISVRFSTNGAKQGTEITPLTGTTIVQEFESETGKFVPLEKYHAPKYFHYFHESGQYMGSMIFFRSVEKSETSKETFDAMTALEPFIKYVYAAFLAMQNAEQPFTSAFRDVQSKMEHEAGFSTQERKVMTLKLCGHSYKQIASHLDISLNTVRSHMTSIHKKTGTRSYTELFAKYFVPIAAEHLP